jgi:hypothetical protein
MLYRIEDGDCLKLLHIPKEDGSGFVEYKKASFIWIDNKILYDDSGIIYKLYNKLRKIGDDSRMIGHRYFYRILHNGDVRYFTCGTSLYKIIKDGRSPNDFWNDYLSVSFQNVREFKDYGNSSIVRNVDDIFKSEDEYFNFILNNDNSKFYEFLYNNSVCKNIDLVMKKYGDVFGEVLSDMRDEKIDMILDF